MNKSDLPRLLICWLACALFSSYSFAADKPKVLVIHSYSDHFPWVQEISEGIDEILGDNFSVDTHYMNTKPMHESAFPEAAQAAMSAYRQSNPRIVIICDDNGFRLVGQELARSGPVVFCGINGDLRVDYPWVKQTRNVTGVMERSLIRRTIFEMVKATNLKAEKALVLLGRSPTADLFYKIDLDSRETMSLWGLLQVDVARVIVYSDWQARVLASKDEGYGLILVAGYRALEDNQGHPVEFDEVNRWLSSHSPVPVFTVHRYAIGKGRVVGGMAVSGLSMGQSVGRMVREILDHGRSPGEVPIVYQDYGSFVFSRDGLDNWNLTIQQDYPNEVILIE